MAQHAPDIEEVSFNAIRLQTHVEGEITKGIEEVGWSERSDPGWVNRDGDMENLPHNATNGTRFRRPSLINPRNSASSSTCTSCNLSKCGTQSETGNISPHIHSAIDACCGCYCPDIKMPEDRKPTAPDTFLRRRSSLLAQLPPALVEPPSLTISDDFSGRVHLGNVPYVEMDLAESHSTGDAPAATAFRAVDMPSGGHPI